MKVKITKQLIDLNQIPCLSINWDGNTRQFHLSLLPFRSHGLWCIAWRTIKPREKGTIIRAINPIHRWKHRVVWGFQRLVLWYMKSQYMKCQGCGEGIAEYKIRDPNQGYGNKWLNCCKHCVSFYDWRLSRMKIVEWKKGKAIAIKST